MFFRLKVIQYILNINELANSIHIIQLVKNNFYIKESLFNFKLIYKYKISSSISKFESFNNHHHHV